LASLLHLQVDPDKLTAAEDSPGASTPSAVPLGLRAFSRHAPDNVGKLHDDPIQLAALSGHTGEQQELKHSTVSCNHVQLHCAGGRIPMCANLSVIQQLVPLQ
jgi:hypothetical protein